MLGDSALPRITADLAKSLTQGRHSGSGIPVVLVLGFSPCAVARAPRACCKPWGPGRAPSQAWGAVLLLGPTAAPEAQ